MVYALPDGADTAHVRLAPGATAGEAIRAAGTLERHREIDLAVCKIGVFGNIVSPGHILQDGDRVEIYRPLRVDPKEARRRRAFRRR